MKLLVDELLCRQNEFIGRQVTVTGVIFVNLENKSFIKTTRESELSINVNYSFAERLLDVVPCYVGGEYLYSDECEIEGRLEFYNNELYLNELNFIKIFRDDEVFICPSKRPIDNG
ncbi:hypothetical protein KIH87_12920 [Paraneptunicella aestuarii]|uniref:hypothetical protein n=1 Tax=Paraneptunicella aestuarii TaxID=2831148 RepID=UPI001E2B311C|nr:hypothetical protein [Paraneptunicella aestuarii]UAA37612.1 hypothetical protein KIH87_12920 [Paraneptunicella aestuarii]